MASATLTPHAPIHISGDADLLAQAAAEGWSGTGTADDPIVISGLSIDTTGPGSMALRIAGTTLHVRIEGNLFLGDGDFAPDFRVGNDGSAVQVADVSRVVISGNQFRGNRGAFDCRASDVVLEGNTFSTTYTSSHPPPVAAAIFTRCVLAFEGNTVTDTVGLLADERSRGVVSNNEITGMTAFGPVQFRDNVVRGGIHVVTGGRATGNTVAGGIHCEGGIVTDNVITAGAGLYGIWVENGQPEGEPASIEQDCFVLRNDITGHGIGIDVLGTGTGSTIEDNRIRGSSTGIRMEFSSVPLVGNTIEGSDVAIRMEHSSGPVVSNTIEGSGVGIHGAPSVVHDNTLKGNGIGLRFPAAPPEENAVVAETLVFNNVFDNDVDLVVGDLTQRVPVLARPNARPNIAGGPLVGGNLWADYEGSDLDHDGFGDVPYEVAGLVDPLPLVVPEQPFKQGLKERVLGYVQDPGSLKTDLRGLAKDYLDLAEP